MKNYLLFFAAFSILTSALAQSPDTARIELPDQRTYWSKTYYNAKDNTYTTEISAGYIHYQANDGSYKDIDTNLRPAGGGAYQVTDGLYQVHFAGAAGPKAGYDVNYALPKPVKPKFRDPGKPAPPTQLRWKILSLGYFDQQSKRSVVIQNANAVTPVVSGSEISYPQVFTGIDVKYNCQNVRLKEEFVLSQTGRNNLPDPTQFGIFRGNAYLMMAVEFALTPANINVFARRQTGKTPVKQGNVFAFEGDDPIDFEDADSTLHFFFPKDYAWAVNDSATNFAGRVSVTRVFYSQGGKDYMLVGVPYGWIIGSPSGTLIIDPAPIVATSEDVWLENASNKNNNGAGLLVGKAAGFSKKRTIIKFNIAGSGIPSSATVLNAQMKLYYYSANNGGSGSWVDRWVQAHQILVSWNEAQATDTLRLTGTYWTLRHVGLNDIDAKSTMESTVFFQLGQTGTWKIWNLAALTQKWVNLTASNNGVVLWATNETTNGYDLRFHSSDAPPPNNANPPVLEVTYSQTPRTVYFLKDHLGSIRATVQDTSTAPVCGYDDYDPWGYILAGRSVNSVCGPTSMVTRNKFTGKEWDDDYGVNWNYFGARYYDPQIGRWMSIDPLAEKHPDFTPYNYVLNNPLILVDPDGRQIHYSYARRANELLAARGRGASEAELNQIRESHQRIDQAAWASVGLIAAGVLAAEAAPYMIAAALSRPVETTEIITGALTPGAENLTAGAASKIANVADDVGKAAAKGQIHHVATDKAIASGFTEKFQAIFSKAGMSLQDEANKIFLQGHVGRHSSKYHEYVLARLNRATKGLSGEKYTQALRKELDVIKADLVKNPDMVKGMGLE